jgi:hypothetical protein
MYKVVETMLCLELPHLGQNDTYDHDELTEQFCVNTYLSVFEGCSYVVHVSFNVTERQSPTLGRQACQIAPNDDMPVIMIVFGASLRSRNDVAVSRRPGPACPAALPYPQARSWLEGTAKLRPVTLSCPRTMHGLLTRRARAAYRPLAQRALIHASASLCAKSLQRFKLADIGEGITECEVIRWCVSPMNLIYLINLYARD